MPAEYYVAWWNLENLFDEENAPPERRTEKVFRTIKNDIVGWTPQLRDRKVVQLASVIAQMNGAAGPDFLGICEVENRFVVELLARAVEGLLPGRSAALAHADTDDAAGSMWRSSTTTASSSSHRRDFLSCGDATQRHWGDRPGQLPDRARRADLGCLREPLAVPQWWAVRIGGISTHCG